MKKTSFIYTSLCMGAIMFASCGGAQQEGNSESEETAAEETTAEPVSNNYTLSEGQVTWKGTMMGMYSHEGTVNVSSGDIQTENGQVVGGTFVIDMTSITPTDENYDAEKDRTPEKLVGHLSSPDFFDVEAHPEAMFTVTSMNGDQVTGMLNIRGVEHEETINDVVVTEADGTISITGSIVVDRQKYGVSFAMTVPDMVLSDEMELGVNVTGATM